MTTDTIEVWREIPGYEGRYQVSDQGRVRGPMGRVLKPQRINSGYLVVHHCKGGRRYPHTVHRLVALAFLQGREPHRHHVNHKNGDKHDNRAANLEWCTPSENVLHAFATGLLRPPSHAVVGESLRDGSVVRFASQRDAEIALSKPRKQSGAINHCLVGKKKSAYGYKWRRA